jgi:hypothetical protein
MQSFDGALLICDHEVNGGTIIIAPLLWVSAQPLRVFVILIVRHEFSWIRPVEGEGMSRDRVKPALAFDYAQARRIPPCEDTTLQGVRSTNSLDTRYSKGTFEPNPDR